MTASEKLRALDGAATPGTWEVDTTADELDIVIRGEHAVGTHYWHLAGPMTMGEDAAQEVRDRALTDAALIATLRNALPLIIEVVKAAEKVASAPEGGSAYDVTVRDGAKFKLRGSLTALTDHLEGGDE